MRKLAGFIFLFAAVALAACSTVAHRGSSRAGMSGNEGPGLPPTPAKALAEYLAVCSEVGGKPDSTKGIHRRDFNGDGVVDYMIDGHEIRCAAAASVWGDRAKLVSIFVGNGMGDATPAFSDSTWGVSLEGKGRNTRLWMGVSAAECGKPPAKDFASENFCDRALVWNAAAARFDYAPLSTVRHLN